MKKNKKVDKFNILAAFSAMILFIMMVVLLVYFIIGNTTKVATIILLSITGASAIMFIVFTILVTLHTGTYSTAPADAFATTGVICTDLLFGIITP